MLVKAVIFSTLVLAGVTHSGVELGALTTEEFDVYSETLRVLRSGSIDGVYVAEQQLLVRSSLGGEPDLSAQKMPSVYHSAFSDLVSRIEKGYRVDLSLLAIEGVLLADSVYFESGNCTVALSSIGFGEGKHTAVVFVTSGCREVPDGFDGEVLVCLSRKTGGWRATDYAVLSPMTWSNVGREYKK